MTVRKVILPGLIAGMANLIASLAVGKCFDVIFPSIQKEYDNTVIFRSWNDPKILLYFIHPFVAGLIFSFLWDRTKLLFSFEGTRRNVARFAFWYCLVSFPGMLISYGTFNISFVMVLSWTTVLLAQAIVSGFIFARMNAFD